MSLTAQEVANIAKLARLNPSEDVLESFRENCNSILVYFDALSNVDTTGVEPLYNPLYSLDIPLSLREDCVNKNNTKADILSNSPVEDMDYFIVPKIVEGK